MDLSPHIEKFARRLAEVEAALSDPEGLRQPAARAGAGKGYARLKELVAAGTGVT